MLENAVGSAAAVAVLALHVPEAVQEGALLGREQVHLLAPAHRALAPEVRNTSLLKLEARRVQLIR
eukprot:10785969-Alexandrium_andersonii.AAC.1